MSVTDKEKAALKKRAINYINGYREIVGLDKAKQCALILVRELLESYERSFNTAHYPDEQAADVAYSHTLSLFEELKNAINAY